LLVLGNELLQPVRQRADGGAATKVTVTAAEGELGQRGSKPRPGLSSARAHAAAIASAS
jgi:hypothetical protein